MDGIDHTFNYLQFKIIYTNRAQFSGDISVALTSYVSMHKCCNSWPSNWPEVLDEFSFIKHIGKRESLTKTVKYPLFMGDATDFTLCFEILDIYRSFLVSFSQHY